MKHTLHIAKSRYVSSILLILLLAFVSMGASSPVNTEQVSAGQIAISKYVTAQQNPALGDEAKIKAAIDAYFTLRYEGQRLLRSQDFSTLVAEATADWVKKEQDKRDIELYVATRFDLNYLSYKFTLDFDQIDVKVNTATVQLRENHEVVFKASAPEISKLSGLEHTFALHRRNGAWVIEKDEYQDELSQQLTHMTVEEIKKQVDENYQADLIRRNSFLPRQGAMPGLKVLAKLSTRDLALNSYSYNRSAAVNYADTYWQNYNTAWYVTYPDNDCTNFVSQAIYAGQGKTPPNTSGMQPAPRDYNNDWYYVWNNSGSLPWIRVDSQYSFITGNTNKVGPYGSGTTNLCGVDLGDVVQYYAGGIWAHEGIVTVIFQQCGPISTYLVNAHTTNRYHYSLANWATYPMRFIRVSGWRGN